MITTVKVVTIDQSHIKEAEKLRQIDENIEIPPSRVKLKRCVLDLRDVEQIEETEYETLNEFDLPVDEEGVLIYKTNGLQFIVAEDFDELETKLFQVQEKEEKDRQDYIEAIGKHTLN